MQKLFLKIKQLLKCFDIFELGNSVAIYYFLMFFILPIAVYFSFPSKIVEWVITYKRTLLENGTFGYLLVGFGAFVFGYQLRFLKTAQKLGNFLKGEWNSTRVLIVFGIFFAISLGTKILKIWRGCYFYLEDSCLSPAIVGLVGFVSWFGLIALAIAFSYYFSLRKEKKPHYEFWRFIAWGTFVLEFAYGFFSGYRGLTILSVIVYLIVKFYLRGHNYKQLIAIVLFILVFVMPYLSFYRNQYFQEYSGEIVSFIFDRSFGRIDQSQQISKVFKAASFLNGESLKNLLVSAGPPKFIWKDKPVGANTSSNEIGRRLGIFHPDDFKSALAPTIVGELFLNFGLAGIVLGMIFFGLFVRFIFDLLIRGSNSSLSGVMMYGILWIQIITGLESWLVVYSGLPRFVFVFLVIHLFLTKKI